MKATLWIRWLVSAFSAAIWIQSVIRSCEICSGQNGIGACFPQSDSVPVATLYSPTDSLSVVYHPRLVRSAIYGLKTKGLCLIVLLN
jgi:hypothetical protein